MTSRKKFPKWFSPASPPYLPGKPIPPLKTIENNSDLVREWSDENYITISVSDLRDADIIRISKDSPYDPIIVRAEKVSSIDNPNYDKEMETYEKNLSKWKDLCVENKKQKKEWKSLKEEWKKLQTEKTKEKELAVLKKLKEKYDGL